jgi:AcrR family transcriptional regulator
MAKRQAKAAKQPIARKARRSAEEITDRIIQAAEIEFEVRGYAGATTAMIAKRAEVTEAQLFRQFDSKQDLFRAAIFTPLNRHFSKFMTQNIADAKKVEASADKRRRYIEELLDFMEQHSGMLMSLLVASQYGPDAGGELREIEGLRVYFERGAALMKSRVGGSARVDPKLAVRVSFAAVLASVMLKDWLFPKGTASAKAIREAIADFVIYGISIND